jgi:hypothetical protein
VTVRIARIYGDDAGETHLETISLADLGPVPDRTPSVGITDVPATTLAVTESLERRPAWDRHPPPRRHLLVALQGAFEITATDGDRVRVEAGTCLLIDDVGSAGHSFTDVGDERLVTVQVGIDPAWRWPPREDHA